MQTNRVFAGVVAVIGLGLGTGAMVFAQSASADTVTVGGQFDPQNITTCSALGLGSDIQLGGETEGTSDENIVVTAGSDSITVDIIGENVVIDAIVVKGGPAYNLTQPGDEGTFFTPDNSSGGPAGLSHYFLCYHIEEVTTTTSPPTTTEAPTTTVPVTTSPPVTTGAPVTTQPSVVLAPPLTATRAPTPVVRQPIFTG